jgi:hypothetical protein
MGTEALEAKVVDEAVLVHMLQAHLDRFLKHLDAHLGRTVCSSIVLAILQGNDEFVSSMLAKLKGILGVSEVSNLDASHARIEPDQVVCALPVDADSLDGASSTVLGSGEAKVLDFDLQHPSDEI